MSSESSEKRKDKVKSPSCGCLIFGLIGLGFIWSITFPQGHMPREKALIAVCRANLQQCRTVLLKYAIDHDGKYPPMSPEPGRLMMNADALGVDSEWMGDFFRCGMNRDTVSGTLDEGEANDYAFYYLNHAITTEAEGLAYVEAYRAAALEGKGFDHDFVLEDGTVIPRIQWGANSESEAYKIPVLIEKFGNHPKKFTFFKSPTSEMYIDGAHVMFLNGSIEFMEMGSGFPMTTEFLDALESIEE